MQEWWARSPRRRSSSRRSRSGWGSTRRTSATSTTTTCRRASSRTRRRSGAPAATARRASASCSPARTTCPTLENFAYGDTPTREALAGLLADVLEHPVGAEFAVSEYELSVRHDLRPLVLKTVLTYLELDGVLRQGTPFYAGYRLRPLGEASLEDVFGRFDESRAGFLRRLVATRQDGPDLDDARARRGGGGARRGAQPRSSPRSSTSTSRGWSSCSRPRCASATRSSPARTPSVELVERLLERFARRERAETGADRERPRARHPRRLPGAARSSATSARRAPSRAATAATA